MFEPCRGQFFAQDFYYSKLCIPSPYCHCSWQRELSCMVFCHLCAGACVGASAATRSSQKLKIENSSGGSLKPTSRLHP